MEVLNYINEVWKPVRDYFNLYEVSNYGRVRSLNYRRTGKTKILRPKKDSSGYLQVCLYKDGKVKNHSVHRLVWEAFVGPIPEGMQINHINERKTDNFIWVNPDGSVDLEKSNLNLMTRKENINWGTGIRRRAKSQSKVIEQYTLNGVYLCTWPSGMSVERKLGHLGFSESSISKCCKGKLKSHKGYIWKYEEPIENK